MEIWSDLAQKCEAKGIKYDPTDDAAALRARLNKKKAKPKKE